MTFFLATFFLIYGGMHCYFFMKANSALGFGRSGEILMGLSMILLVMSPLLVRTLEREGHEAPARILAWPIYTWMGFLLLFVSASLFLDLHRFVKFLFNNETISSCLTPPRLFSIPLIVSLFATLYGYWEASSIRTERLTIESSKLPDMVERIRIVQISDLHLGLMAKGSRLRKILEIVKKEDPDLLVSTGDLVDGQGSLLDGISNLFTEVNPRYGKYAVTGNHEFYAGLDQALAFLKRAGFTVLRGSGVTLSGAFNIAGVDDEAGKKSGRLKVGDEKALFSSLPEDLFTILLKHRPVVTKESLNRVDLQLSGHTHKGQIFPFGLIVKLLYPNMAGLKIFPNGSRLYSSRGSGTWGPPIRVLSPPEVTVIEIVKKILR